MRSEYTETKLNLNTERQDYFVANTLFIVCHFPPLKGYKASNAGLNLERSAEVMQEHVTQHDMTS